MRVAGPAPGVIALQIGRAQDLDRESRAAAVWSSHADPHVLPIIMWPIISRTSVEKLPCGPQILLKQRPCVRLTRTIAQAQHVGWMVSDDEDRAAVPQGATAYDRHPHGMPEQGFGRRRAQRDKGMVQRGHPASGTTRCGRDGARSGERSHRRAVRVMRPAAVTSSPRARDRAPRIWAFGCPTFGRSSRSRPSRHRGKGVIVIVIVYSGTYKRTILDPTERFI